jgi:hypothetical protein
MFNIRDMSLREKITCCVCLAIILGIAAYTIAFFGTPVEVVMREEKHFIETENYERIDVNGQIIFYDDQVSQEDIDKCIEYVNMATGYERDHVIILSSHAVSEHKAQKGQQERYGYNTEAITCQGLRQDVIIVSTWFIDSSLMHELGHAVDNHDVYSTNDWFVNYYNSQEDAIAYQNGNIFVEYKYESVSEFFAESYQEWQFGELEDETLRLWYETHIH